jgi:hypothetical protein
LRMSQTGLTACRGPRLGKSILKPSKKSTIGMIGASSRAPLIRRRELGAAADVVTRH